MIADVLSPGCGCDELIRASSLVDPAERTNAERQGAEWQEQWQCPCAGHPEPSGESELDPVCRATEEIVERMTGVAPSGTCPMYGTRHPWVARAIRARAWREHGELAAVEPDASLALIDAVDAIDSGYAARCAVEDKQRREKHPASGGG